MVKCVFFPFGVFWFFAVSTILALTELSVFFDVYEIYKIFPVLILLAFFALFPLVSPRKRKHMSEVECEIKTEYGTFFQLVLLGIFFASEFAVYGVPFLVGSRAEFKGFDVLHVAAYGYLFYLNARTVTAGRFSAALTVFIFSCIVGALMLSRQLMMYSFLVFSIGLLYSGKIKLRSIVILLSVVVALFGILGEIRESGGGGYIYEVGGANELGAKVPSSIYWVWLYMSSPVYNLLYNLPDNLFTLDVSNPGRFLAQIIIPEFLATRLDLVPDKPMFVMEHLNVATGFGLSARYAGLLGVLIHFCFIVMFYMIGRIALRSFYRRVFVLHFSICAVLFVFDNKFTQAEYFMVFVYIFIFYGANLFLKNIRVALSRPI